MAKFAYIRPDSIDAIRILSAMGFVFMPVYKVVVYDHFDDCFHSYFFDEPREGASMYLRVVNYYGSSRAFHKLLKDHGLLRK